MHSFSVESLLALYIKDYKVFKEVTGLDLDKYESFEVIMLEEKVIEELIAVNAFSKIIL